MSNFDRLQGIPPEPVCVHSKTVMGCPGCTARNKRFAVKAIAERDQLRQQVEKLEHDLAECYRLTGSDPDGDPDSMLAKHAVDAVRELREEADKAGEWEDAAGEWEDAAVRSGRAVRTLLGLSTQHHQAADQVRKELEG